MNACTGPDRPAIEVLHLRKTYGDTTAVDDVSFSVAEGEIFGILGPNGAGKTTTIECALGLRSPDSGSIRVMGLNPGEDREELHLIVGAQLQASALPGLLKVGEILGLYRSFYRQPADVAAPKSAGGLVLALSVSIAGVFAIGLWVSAIARPRTAGILAAVCFFPLMFFAGLFFPRAEMPRALLDVSSFTPLGAAVQAIQSALLNGFPPIAPLLVLPAYAVIFGALAVRFFRWE